MFRYFTIATCAALLASPALAQDAAQQAGPPDPSLKLSGGVTLVSPTSSATSSIFGSPRAGCARSWRMIPPSRS